MHLRNAALYHTSPLKEFSAQCQLHNIWVSTAKDADRLSSIISRLKIKSSSCPVSHRFIKTHKLSIGDFTSSNFSNFKVRNIISCVGGCTDNISRFLNPAFAPHLGLYILAQMSFDHLRSTSFSRNRVMESSDVEALYTDISNDSATQAVFTLDITSAQPSEGEARTFLRNLTPISLSIVRQFRFEAR